MEMEEDFNLFDAQDTNIAQPHFHCHIHGEVDGTLSLDFVDDKTGQSKRLGPYCNLCVADRMEHLLALPKVAKLD